jgi:hypothetical protein
LQEWQVWLGLVHTIRQLTWTEAGCRRIPGPRGWIQNQARQMKCAKKIANETNPR